MADNSETAAFMVDRSAEPRQKLWRWILMEAKSDDNPEPLLESVCRLATVARLQVAANSPGRKRRELLIQVAVDVTQGVITEFVHLNSFIGGGLGRGGAEGEGPPPMS